MNTFKWLYLSAGGFLVVLAAFIMYVGKIDVAGRSAPMSGEVKSPFYITLESDPVMFLVVVGFLVIAGLFLIWGAWQKQPPSDDD